MAAEVVMDQVGTTVVEVAEVGAKVLHMEMDMVVVCTAILSAYTYGPQHRPC